MGNPIMSIAKTTESNLNFLILVFPNIMKIMGNTAAETHGLKLKEKMIKTNEQQKSFSEIFSPADSIIKARPNTNKLNMSPSLVICELNISAE